MSTSTHCFRSSSPPPMPRRQSCDRCHDQKVRCYITDGPDEIFTPGGTADDQVSQNGHFISSYPCKRCKKAGATCIFSPQLRSGRPRIPRDPLSTVSARKRMRTPTSSSPSFPSLSPAPSISALSTPPPPTSNPSSYFPTNDDNSSSTLSSYMSQGSSTSSSFHYPITSPPEPLMLPAAETTPPLSDLDTTSSQLTDYPASSTFDPWLFQSLDTGGDRPLTGFPSIYSGSSSTSSLYSSTSATTLTGSSDYSSYLPSSSSVDTSSWSYADSTTPYYGDYGESDRHR